MATKQLIRKNIITGEWEHYVDIPLFKDYHWAPGIFDYYGEFPPPSEASHSIIRNGEGFLLSYEDVNYIEYKADSLRNLPTYTETTTIYDIKFGELYTPENSLTVLLKKINPTFNTVDIEATIVGGYPYRYPDVHYDFRWSTRDFDTTYTEAFNSQKNTLRLNGIGVGIYTLRVWDANRIYMADSINVTNNDFTRKERPQVDDELLIKDMTVNLYFIAEDVVRERGYLRAKVSPSNSSGPWKITWKSGTKDMSSEIVRNEAINDILQFETFIGKGEYSIEVNANSGEVAMDSLIVSDTSFPDDIDDSGDYVYTPEVRDTIT